MDFTPAGEEIYSRTSGILRFISAWCGLPSGLVHSFVCSKLQPLPWERDTSCSLWGGRKYLRNHTNTCIINSPLAEQTCSPCASQHQPLHQQSGDLSLWALADPPVQCMLKGAIPSYCSLGLFYSMEFCLWLLYPSSCSKCSLSRLLGSFPTHRAAGSRKPGWDFLPAH